MDPEHEQKPHDEELTEQILKEAERRVQQKEQGAPPQNTDAILRANKAVFWLSRHWIGMLNTIIFLYTGGAILAPALAYLGWPRLASALYAFYSPFCHQYPFRSWFVFGERFVYPLSEAPLSVAAMSAAHSFIGNAEMGYKMALCQRDMAIYGAMLGAGLIYGLLPQGRRPKSLPLWIFFVFAFVPMLLDGGIQWLAYAAWQLLPGLMAEPFETVPAMRALTGILFGLGITAIGYPEMEKYFTETIETLHLRYGWKR
jgi:uncharacterized membrane protein